jgi:UDPglucose 6-dehydrogenase
MGVTVGFIGLGKLGLPVALAINAFGFDVYGTDIQPEIKSYLVSRTIPYQEIDADTLLKTHTIHWCDTMAEVISNADVIFMPIQTPHDQQYDGTELLPPERKDFDYSFLKTAIQNFVNALGFSSDPSPKTLVIISTVLPGTIRRELLPILNKNKRIVLIYNPFFIAMGTVIPDFLNPEFILLGMEDKGSIPGHLLQIYNKIYTDAGRLYKPMSIESAELTKVAYNTYITSKICIVNTIMEICHKIPKADIDDITDALKQATGRLVSTKYMTGGMGDGGGCHPRDNIAMSWLAKNLDLSYDWFENLMISRQRQAAFFANLVLDEYKEGDNVFILGYEFKPETNLTIGSHALLVYNILKLDVDVTLLQSSGSEDYKFPIMKKGKNIIFIGCKHEKFDQFEFPSGTVVIDPFRFIRNQTGVKVIAIGEGK